MYTTKTLPQIPRIRALADSPRLIKNAIQVFEEYRTEFGTTFSFHFGGVKKVIVSCNPLVIEHILKTNHENYHKSEIQMKRMGHFLGRDLLTSNGKQWLRQRRLIQPYFHKSQLPALLNTMHTVLNESLKRFDREIEKGAINICPEMMKMTFGIIARSLLSESLKEEELQILSKNISDIQEFIMKQIVRPYLNPWYFISGELRKYESIAHRSNEMIHNYLTSRRNDNSNHNDLLQILLESIYEDTGETMSDKQVVSEISGLMVGGHETSSNALSWTWYLLSKNRNCVDKIKHELKREIGDAPLQYSDLPKLEYTMQVLNEVMRLYPPVWMIDREALSDDNINGVIIPKGVTVISYIYGLHNAKEYWNDPEKFDPDRFSKENKKNLTPNTYLPFGGGPRGCLGNNYAIMQMLLILVTMLRKYDFELEHFDEIEMHPLVVLKPKDGIQMQFKKIV